MKAKELKRLSRGDLLEMMLALSKENEQLRADNAQLRGQLEDRSIKVEKAGSLAEAALQLSGVFEAAQVACEQYAENIRIRSENLEEVCRRKEQETQVRCDQMLAEAQRQADACLLDARRQAEKYLAKARYEAKTSEYAWLAELLENEKAKEDKQ